jgi:membrane protease YdiL (CAAX protease family)
MQGDVMQRFLIYFSLTLTVPLSEEIFFRVFLFIFLKQFTGKRTAVILSSLLFAFNHGSILLFPYYFLTALLLSLAYLRTKSIFPSII